MTIIQDPYYQELMGMHLNVQDINIFLHEYSCLAPPTMINYINKRSCWYIEQRNDLSGPRAKD